MEWHKIRLLGLLIAICGCLMIVVTASSYYSYVTDPEYRAAYEAVDRRSNEQKATEDHWNCYYNGQKLRNC